MGNIVICDDDRNIAGLIKEKVRTIFQNHGVDMDFVVFTEPNEALLYCGKTVTDFILLDIDMPQMSGFELSKRLLKLPDDKILVVIFMSSQEHFVYEAFQYKPFDFLRKSCLQQDLENKIERLIREYDYNCERVELTRGEEAYVRMKDVYFFKSDRNKVNAYTQDGCYRCRDKISDMENKYENCLIRTSVQYLVNMNHIHRIGVEQVILKNGEKIPLSRRRRKYVEEKYEKLKRK